MWGDLIFPISPFIMPKFAGNLTINYLTEMFICNFNKLQVVLFN